MTLGKLITRLQAADPDLVVPIGFDHPHSHRGDYSELAFEPKKGARVGDMLAVARGALGKTFQGYKGGDYRMTEWTPVNLANYGDCGEGIGPVLLDYMLGAV